MFYLNYNAVTIFVILPCLHSDYSVLVYSSLLEQLLGSKTMMPSLLLMCKLIKWLLKADSELHRDLGTI